MFVISRTILCFAKQKKLRKEKSLGRDFLASDTTPRAFREVFLCIIITTNWEVNVSVAVSDK